MKNLMSHMNHILSPHKRLHPWTTPTSSWRFSGRPSRCVWHVLHDWGNDVMGFSLPNHQPSLKPFIQSCPSTICGKRKRNTLKQLASKLNWMRLCRQSVSLAPLRLHHSNRQWEAGSHVVPHREQYGRA